MLYEAWPSELPVNNWLENRMENKENVKL